MRERIITSLCVEEHEGLMEGKGVVIRSGVRVAVTARHVLGDDDNEDQKDANPNKGCDNDSLVVI